MKKTIFVFLMLASISWAQENWGPGEYIGGGSILLDINPCFTPDTGAILLTGNHPRRIHILYLYLDWEEQYLPESLSVEGYNDCSPFLNADGNRLYFASNRPGGHGSYDIWMTEKVADNWIQPVNLGPEINSPGWEETPSLTANESEMYFVRVDSQYWDSGGDIYYSEFGDEGWGSAEIVPPPISIGAREGSPAISWNGDRLYFNSHRANGLEGDLAVWVSYRQNGIWQEPLMLSGYINSYDWQCTMFLVGWPYSVTISNDNNRLLYNKIYMFEMPGWDCIDPITSLFISERAVSVDDNRISLPGAISLSAYPNPFNSSVKISVEFPDANSDLTIYDILGRPVKSYDITSTTATLEWRGDDKTGHPCASGIYFIRARSGELQKTLKMMMLR